MTFASPTMQGTAERPLRVIVVEDNVDLREELVFQLDHAGIRTRGARDGQQLDMLLAQSPCDILILDVNLPGEDGFSIAQRLYDPKRLGIVMLTGRRSVEDRIDGLERGADVYLVKPIDRRELLATVRRLYQRLASEIGQPGWRLARISREIRGPNDAYLQLTPQEFVMLSLLLESGSRICSRSEIAETLGISDMSGIDIRINTLMSRLRQRLEEIDPALRIQTWRNQGYSYIGPTIDLTQRV